MGLYLGDQKVAPIVGVPVAKEKFGATVDTFIGDVNEDGELSGPTKQASVVFDGVKKIGYQCGQYMFYFKENIIDAAFPDLTTIDGANACTSMFHGCSNLTSISLPVLTTISGSDACSSMFAFCYGLTNVSFPALTTIDGANACTSMFSYCSNLTSISFPLLTTISSINAFGNLSFNYIFNSCYALTEIHFRADAQATVEAMTGYANKWGATNATISFDL